MNNTDPGNLVFYIPIDGSQPRPAIIVKRNGGGCSLHVFETTHPLVIHSTRGEGNTFVTAEEYFLSQRVKRDMEMRALDAKIEEVTSEIRKEEKPPEEKPAPVLLCHVMGCKEHVVNFHFPVDAPDEVQYFCPAHTAELKQPGRTYTEEPWTTDLSDEQIERLVAYRLARPEIDKLASERITNAVESALEAGKEKPEAEKKAVQDKPSQDKPMPIVKKGAKGK
jgi:hypothetical protein